VTNQISEVWVWTKFEKKISLPVTSKQVWKSGEGVPWHGGTSPHMAASVPYVMSASPATWPAFVQSTELHYFSPSVTASTGRNWSQRNTRTSSYQPPFALKHSEDRGMTSAL